jgi:Protein of unknown function (DUF998)
MLKPNITTEPLSPFASGAARVAFAAAVLFLILLAAMHVLEPQLSPSWRFISDYELGRFGWLMQVAFFSLAVSATSLWLAVRSQIKTVGGYIGLLCLLLNIVGFTLAGLFVADLTIATHATAHGRLHSMGAVLGGNVAGAACFLAWSLARNKAWVPLRRSLLWITSIAIVGTMVSFWMQSIIAHSDGKFGPHVMVGWPNRMLIIGIAAWLLAMAWRLKAGPVTKRTP